MRGSQLACMVLPTHQATLPRAFIVTLTTCVYIYVYTCMVHYHYYYYYYYTTQHLSALISTATIFAPLVTISAPLVLSYLHPLYLFP